MLLIIGFSLIGSVILIVGIYCLFLIIIKTRLVVTLSAILAILALYLLYNKVITLLLNIYFIIPIVVLGIFVFGTAFIVRHINLNRRIKSLDWPIPKSDSEFRRFCKIYLESNGWIVRFSPHHAPLYINAIKGKRSIWLGVAVSPLSLNDTNIKDIGLSRVPKENKYIVTINGLSVKHAADLNARQIKEIMYHDLKAIV
jgi:hypothetical protein